MPIADQRRGPGQPAYRERDGGEEAEERGGAVVVGVAHGLSAVGRAALGRVTGEVPAVRDEGAGAVAGLVDVVPSVLDQVAGAVAHLVGEVAAVVDEVLGPVAGAAIAYWAPPATWFTAPRTWRAGSPVRPPTTVWARPLRWREAPRN